MATTTVGIREFRDNLATYILEADKPIAITRHGDTVGLFIPTRRKRTEADWAALNEAAELVQKDLAAAGLTEDDIIADFQRWRKEQRLTQ